MRLKQFYLHLNRLNYLKYVKDFQFGRSSVLTLTSESYKRISDFHKAKTRLMLWLKRRYGLQYYVSVSEYQKRSVIHYHIILFNVPYIPKVDIEKEWGLGWVWIKEIDNLDGAMYYLLKYLSLVNKSQNHLRFVWSKSFEDYFKFHSSLLLRFDKKESRIYNVIEKQNYTIWFKTPSDKELLQFWKSVRKDKIPS